MISASYQQLDIFSRCVPVPLHRGWLTACSACHDLPLLVQLHERLGSALGGGRVGARRSKQSALKRQVVAPTPYPGYHPGHTFCQRCTHYPGTIRRYAALLLACSCGSSQQQARRPQTAVMSARRRAVGGKKMQLFNDTLPPQRMVFVVVCVLAGFSAVESDSGPEDDLYSDEQIDRCILSLSCCCSRSRSLVPFLSPPLPSSPSLPPSRPHTLVPS